ncbi:MAG: porin [Myxococcaceae bacterium]|nr:porin [Myxococcaceae bacterium]MCA3016040.1 porin [Myxococcaceae bacterium]
MTPLLLATLLASADGGLELPALSPAAPAPAAATAPSAPPGTRATVDARFGEGVTFKAQDFSLQLRGRVQARAEALVPTEGAPTTRLNQFLIRRARLNLTAKYTEAWVMTVQLAFSALDMEADAPNVLRDAHLTWQGLRDLNVRVGQTKVPYGKQRVVSSGSLQMVDRSLVVGELNLDRDVGLQLRSDDLLGLGGRLAYAVGVFGGDGRNRFGANVGLLYVARLQVSPFGRFDDLVEGDLERLERPRLAVGLAAARNVATFRQRSTIGATFKTEPTTYDHLGADVLFKWRGFSLMGEVLWRDAEREPVGAPTLEWPRSAWGYYVQAGVVLVPQLEVSARWGQLRPLPATDPSLLHQRELGVGLGWYPLRHDLKLQTDVFWLPVGERFDVGTLQLRAQLQLSF